MDEDRILMPFQVDLQGRSQDFSKRGSQLVTLRVLATLSCPEYFDTKKFQQSEFSNHGFWGHYIEKERSHFVDSSDLRVFAP